MKILLIISCLTLITFDAFCQQDSLTLKLSTVKVDKDNLKYSVKFEFISNKRNEISFQTEPRYLMPNELDGVGFKFEHLEGDCYKSYTSSDVHPLPNYDILKDNVTKMSFGDTTTIIFNVDSYIKTFIGRINGESKFIYKGQHRIRAYRTYHDEKGYSTKLSNWLYINFDELK
ncbi:MAG TPA: hypothetical protein VF476_14545 [Chitinophagaceae bacterium]